MKILGADGKPNGRTYPRMYITATVYPEDGGHEDELEQCSILDKKKNSVKSLVRQCTLQGANVQMNSTINERT